MISFSKGTTKFNYRAAGIVIHQGRVLIHRSELDNFWAIPGGRVEWGEPVAITLKREMQEELEHNVVIEHLPWVVENFYQSPDQIIQELCFYYLVSLPQDCPLLKQEEFGGEDIASSGEKLKLFFRWCPVAELQQLELYPGFLRKGLQNIPDQTEFLSFSDLPKSEQRLYL